MLGRIISEIIICTEHNRHGERRIIRKSAWRWIKIQILQYELRKDIAAFRFVRISFRTGFFSLALLCRQEPKDLESKHWKAVRCTKPDYDLNPQDGGFVSNPESTIHVKEPVPPDTSGKGYLQGL